LGLVSILSPYKLQTITGIIQFIALSTLHFYFLGRLSLLHPAALRQEELTPLLQSALACARFLLFSLRVKKINC
jgi:hypothetical protein